MKKFKKDDTVMVLIDHQLGTINFAANRSQALIISRTRALARMAKVLNIPVVLTSSLEDNVQGLLIPDLKEILSDEYENRIKRADTTNAWEDKDFRSAVIAAADGRKNVIMAGLTNDVCIVWPAISMQEEGYDIQVVIDAGGSPTQIADDIAQQTWEKQGVRTTTINQLISELIHSWTSADGQKVMPVMFEEVLSKIGLLQEAKS